MAVFIFRRDLRIEDNTTLQKCLQDNHEVLPIFIFPREQISPKKNVYFSHPAVQFLCESLRDLDNSLGQKLCMFQGDNVATLEKLYLVYPFKKLYFNKDLSVYANERDDKIRNWCKKHNIDVISYEDYGLIGEKEGLVPSTNHPYYVLAPFYRRFLIDIQVRKPAPRLRNKPSWVTVPSDVPSRIDWNMVQTFYTENKQLAQRGGRREGVQVLQRIKKDTYKSYGETRDYPAIDGTTKVSAHLRFGTISIREMYWTLVAKHGKDHPLIRELVFREFYLKIYTHHPELQRGVAYRKDLDHKIRWNMDPNRWKAWTEGKTGYPLVDAGMRQLLATGWMHNRVRMNVASVATRYFLLDWRNCAQFFYQHLVDADPFSNTAGWMWSAGVGVDSAPYVRAPFNPFRQSKRFDTQAEYIKRWVPELRDVATSDIHNWNKIEVRQKYPNIKYPAPMDKIS